MIDKKFLLSYFRKSVRLDESSTVSDPAYVFSVEDLWDIIRMSIMAHNPLYSEVNLPEGETYFVILKAKEEVYYRLATSSAPFYPIEAEGASLRKDYRFEHYMSLVRRVEQEYTTMWAKFESEKVMTIGDIIIAKNHFTRRSYNLANTPDVEFVQCIPSTEHIDIEWTKFQVKGGLFSKYVILIHDRAIYDSFEDTVSDKANVLAEITDIHKTKLRIKGLVADTNYHLLVKSQDRNGLTGYKEIECKTLPIEY